MQLISYRTISENVWWRWSIREQNVDDWDYSERIWNCCTVLARLSLTFHNVHEDHQKKLGHFGQQKPSCRQDFSASSMQRSAYVFILPLNFPDQRFSTILRRKKTRKRAWRENKNAESQTKNTCCLWQWIFSKHPHPHAHMSPQPWGGGSSGHEEQHNEKKSCIQSVKKIDRPTGLSSHVLDRCPTKYKYISTGNYFLSSVKNSVPCLCSIIFSFFFPRLNIHTLMKYWMISRIE